MADTRHKDVNWILRASTDGTLSWDGVKVAVLMDIRDELQKLNRLLHCGNFTDIPRVLRSIQDNTVKPKRKRAKRVERA